MNKKRCIIIGGGFSGCAVAHLLSESKNWECAIIESGGHLGAGVWTNFYGGHPYTFGPRHFLTQNEKTYEYLNKIVPLRRCQEHEFLTYVEPDNSFYNYPINMDDIAKMPDKAAIYAQLEVAKKEKLFTHAKNLEEFWIRSVGEILYRKMVKYYNHKMWLVDSNTQIDTFNWSPKGVAIKEGSRACWDTAISAYPIASDGYNQYFGYATKNAKVYLNTRAGRVDLEKSKIQIGAEAISYDLLINTISPDWLLNYEFGELEFMGRDFHKIVLPTEHVFPENVYFLYYANQEKFTRLVEYKKLTRHKSPTSLIGLEIPSRNGKHYPMPFNRELQKAETYYQNLPKNVYSIGRAGSYRYGLDIDDCIEQAMQIIAELNDGGREHPVPGKRWREFNAS
jgi:UDP-galactopyranose mutase